MTLPYSKIYSFEADSDSDVCLEIPAPPRGTLRRLIVKQTAGALDGFDFDLYDRHDACAGVSQESCNPGDEEFDSDLHKISATETVLAAADTHEDFEVLLPYENKDSLCDGLHGAKRSLIYMRLNPVASGAKTFQVAITVTSDLT
jgi:hypothetical protein